MQPLISQLSARHYITCWGILMPFQHTLIFLFKTGRLEGFPFTAIWKCLCQGTTPLHGAQPHNAMNLISLLKLTRSLMSTSIPTTPIVTKSKNTQNKRGFTLVVESKQDSTSLQLQQIQWYAQAIKSLRTSWYRYVQYATPKLKGCKGGGILKKKWTEEGKTLSTNGIGLSVTTHHRTPSPKCCIWPWCHHLPSWDIITFHIFCWHKFDHMRFPPAYKHWKHPTPFVATLASSPLLAWSFFCLSKGYER